MRISDWSSDVCSSDLLLCDDHAGHGADGVLLLFAGALYPRRGRAARHTARHAVRPGPVPGHQSVLRGDGDLRVRLCGVLAHHQLALRSEEHKSELQSLMRTSYAFFCLKKKHKQK